MKLQKNYASWWRKWRQRNWDFGPYENLPDSPLVTIGPGVRPPLSTVAEALREFWFAHWKWIIGTVLAVVGLVAGMLRS